MALERVHSFLVHAGKGLDAPPEIGGTEVPRKGRLGDMLAATFDRAPRECEIDIVFQKDASGKQHNACRDDLVRYAAKSTIANGRKVAHRLQAVTTHRPGLGLLFLMVGTEGSAKRLVLSRFPADQGIIAEEHQAQLSVEFIERVFMKSATAYKSALYQSASLDGGFWDGRVVDRQISGPREVSDYWIRQFLQSDLRTTGAAGTKRIAVALATATRSATTLNVKSELIAAAELLRGRDQQVATGRQLVESLGLSDESISALEQQLPRPDLMDEAFQFDRQEFEKHVVYRWVELDNGGMVAAEDQSFDKVFDEQVVDPEAGVVRFATQGRVVDERLRKSK